LEAMQEQSVTVGGKVHRLENPFMVLATQNPIEMEGTYPLPRCASLHRKPQRLQSVILRLKPARCLCGRPSLFRSKFHSADVVAGACAIANSQSEADAEGISAEKRFSAK
jgi:hypothetical protein